MTARRISLLTSLLALFLLQATPGAAVADCSAGGKAHRLKIKVKNDQCVERVAKESDESDADTINVCEGDTVSWSFSGPKKSIIFDGENPLEWVDSGNAGSKIEGIVKAGAAKDGQQTSYKYSVTVEGQACVFDPKIIVDR